MKKALVLTLIFSIALSCPCYASEETHRLAREAGIEYDTPLEEVLRRQEARNQSKTNNSTPTTENSREKAQRPLKSSVDEYRVIPQGGNESTQVTDTDGLHIYSNDYADGYTNAYYGAKNSYDEFHTTPYDIGANDGYDESTWGELHINRNYRKDVYYEPEKDKNRLGIDEYRLPWQMN